MEYYNSLFNQNWPNIIGRWEETPSTMNEMITIHGIPSICHEDDENGTFFCMVFPDKAIVILDKTVVKPLLDLELKNWLDVIDKEKIRIQFYREIATGFVGFYAYYNSSEKTCLHEKDYVFSIIRETHYNIHFVTLEGVGKAICKDGRIYDIECDNDHFVISKGALYQLIYSDTEILVNAENEYSQDGCTSEKLVDILNLEKFSLIRYFDKDAQPTICIEKELFISNESFLVTPQVSIIEAYSFYKNMNLERIVIPYTVDEVCDRAFACCGKLQVIEFCGIPSKIHPDAFAYSGLINVIIPDGSKNSFAIAMSHYPDCLIEKSKYIPIDIPLDKEQCTKKHSCQMYAVHYNKKIGFINDFGEIVITADFDSIIGDFNDNTPRIVAKKCNQWFAVDKTGYQISIDIEGKPIKLLDNRYLIIEKGWNLHALYDIDEKVYVLRYGQYDYLGNYSSRWRALRVRKGNKWGVIRTDGAIILPIIYPKVIMGEDFCVYIDEKGIRKKLYFINHELYQAKCGPIYGEDYDRESWYAMTDGMHGDYPNTDTDFEFLGK